jgi:hypothetical protein
MQVQVVLKQTLQVQLMLIQEKPLESSQHPLKDTSLLIKQHGLMGLQAKLKCPAYEGPLLKSALTPCLKNTL